MRSFGFVKVKRVLLGILCAVLKVTVVPETPVTVTVPLISPPSSVTTAPVLISKLAVLRVAVVELLVAPPLVLAVVIELELVSGIVKLNAVTPFLDSKNATISSTSVLERFEKLKD